MEIKTENNARQPYADMLSLNPIQRITSEIQSLQNRSPVNGQQESKRPQETLDANCKQIPIIPVPNKHSVNEYRVMSTGHRGNQCTRGT